jgi:predicted PhzF superfamily epimerase YddE/YHI9
MSMNHPIYVIDAFTDRPFAGNPAGVVLLQEAARDDWMQKVAAEMKHAETAFVNPAEGDYDLRWFTPVAVVDLCGHATLAAAHALAARGAEGPFRFRTRSGLLTARTDQGSIVLDFPSEAPWAQKMPSDLDKIVGASPVWFGRNRLDWFVQVADGTDLPGCQVDCGKIADLGLRGLVLTAKGTEFDFVSRFFGPAVGLPEDSVTGSAHCALAPFWAERLGKNDMRGYQASARGGMVGVRLAGDRIELRGFAVTILEGLLYV